MKNTITSLLLIAITASSCSTTKPGYAYTIGEGFTESIWYGCYISYGKDLFQYNLMLSGINTISAQDDIQQTDLKQWVDTIGIYYLDAAKRQYVLFRRFTDTSSIIKSGPFSKKENGIQIADTIVKRAQNILSSAMRDTIIAGQQLRYETMMNKSGDTIKVIQYFISDKELTTIYDMITLQYPGTDLHCVGLDVLVNDKPAPMMHAVISGLRPLTKAEKRTCARLRKRALNAL